MSSVLRRLPFFRSRAPLREGDGAQAGGTAASVKNRLCLSTVSRWRTALHHYALIVDFRPKQNKNSRFASVPSVYPLCTPWNRSFAPCLLPRSRRQLTVSPGSVESSLNTCLFASDCPDVGGALIASRPVRADRVRRVQFLAATGLGRPPSGRKTAVLHRRNGKRPSENFLNLLPHTEVVYGRALYGSPVV